MCVCISAAVSRLYSAWQAALRDYCRDSRVSATDGALCIKTDGFYLDVMGLSDGGERRRLSADTRTNTREFTQRMELNEQLYVREQRVNSVQRVVQCRLA